MSDGVDDRAPKAVVSILLCKPMEFLDSAIPGEGPAPRAFEVLLFARKLLAVAQRQLTIRRRPSVRAFPGERVSSCRRDTQGDP